VLAALALMVFGAIECPPSVSPSSPNQVWDYLKQGFVFTVKRTESDRARGSRTEPSWDGPSVNNAESFKM